MRSHLRYLLGGVAGLALTGWTSLPVAPWLELSPGAAVAAVGPPWISIEYPPSPFDPSTRGALLLVHAFHHGTPMNFPISGTAEGIVNGDRVSRTLSFARSSRTGVYALRKQWPDEGVWTLAISVKQGPADSVTALVELGQSGEVASVRVPTERRDGWDIPKAVSMREIDDALRGRAARLARR